LLSKLRLLLRRLLPDWLLSNRRLRACLPCLLTRCGLLLRLLFLPRYFFKERIDFALNRLATTGSSALNLAASGPALWLHRLTTLLSSLLTRPSFLLLLGSLDRVHDPTDKRNYQKHHDTNRTWIDVGQCWVKNYVDI
jgi:hypothetical protein